jgi:thioredoxin 2
MADVIRTVCPHCQKTASIPTSLIKTDTPHCSHCHKRLFTGQVAALSDERLKRNIRHDQIPLLADFWAPGCRPCKMMMPLLDQAAKRYLNTLRFVKVNTQEYPSTIKTHRIRAVPTLILFKRGKELDRLTGAIKQKQLDTWISKQL